MFAAWLWVLIVLGVPLLLLGFLLLGALRRLELLSWRMEQLEATNLRRFNRNGLRVGAKAPDFTLPGADGGEVSLSEYAGRRVLLVFTQVGCGPCSKLIPDLHRTAERDVPVLVVNHGAPEDTVAWAREKGIRVPVAVQRDFEVSKRYQCFSTPFAFLIDEQGRVASQGIVNNRQHIRFVLSGASGRINGAEAEVPQAPQVAS